MNRIYVYPWDQLSKSAGAIAKGLDTQKLLRKKSRYTPQRGDVIVNWGASDIGPWLDERLPYVGAAIEMSVLNRDVSGALDKVQFFQRLLGTGLVPECAYGKDGARLLNFPVLCRTKTKGCDGAGIVVAETPDDLVDAKLFVALEAKTAEYRVHIGRDPNGATSIIGVQQKFLPKGKPKDDMRLRTTANGCYFVWTVDGELVENIVPPTVLAVTSAMFKLFPELTFCGADVIYNEATGQAFVIEINSAPEMTPQSVERYARFFNQFRVPPLVAKDFAEVEVPALAHHAVIEAEDAALIARNGNAIDDAFDDWLDTQPHPNAISYHDVWQAAWQAALDAEKAVELPVAADPVKDYFMWGIEGERIDVV